MKSVSLILAFGIFASTVSAQAASWVCFQKRDGQKGRVMIDEVYKNVSYSGEGTGALYSLQEKNNVAVITTYFEPGGGDGYPATIVIDAQSVTLKQKDRVLETSVRIPCK